MVLSLKIQVKQRPEGHLMYKLSACFFLFSTILAQDRQSSVLQIRNWLSHPPTLAHRDQGFIFGQIIHEQPSNILLPNLS